jgi:D-glycero-D-manno-heptose 1,7-bisphosphate phosphatase
MDRDGTVCEEVGYLDRVEKLRLLPGSAEAIRRANAAGLQTLVLTNQSGVARGRFDETLLADVHERLRELLADAGARLDGIYHCPHHPQHGEPPYRAECECRKPAAGMLWRARDEMGIDLEGSYMVGDRMSDVEAATRAGTTPILVLTGVGRRERESAEAPGAARPAHVADDLLGAVEWILARETAS